MAFKDFLKKNWICVALVASPIVFFEGVPLYYSHQRNKDPIGYDQRIIKERIGQLEKRNSQILEHFNREPSSLELLTLPVKMVFYMPKVLMDIFTFGRPIGLPEEEYANECEIERLRERYSDLEKQRDI